MKWTSILAIYTLFWAFSAFFVLPFHGRRAEDEAAGADHERKPNLSRASSGV